MSRILAILLLTFAVFVQCSPLRACELSAITSGRTCHDLAYVADGDMSVPMVASTGHADGPVGGHEDTCICNTPKGAEGQFGHAVIPDLTPFVTGPVLIASPMSTAPDAYANRVRCAPPPGPNPPQVTPLLI